METPFEKPPTEEKSTRQTGIEAIERVLEHPQTMGLKRDPNEHIHKNDEGLGYIIEQIHNYDVETDKLRVGIVVGNGAILSVLPDVPADVLIIIDYNPFILEWTGFTLQALIQSQSPKEYKQRVYSETNPLYAELVKKGLKPDDGLQRELQDLGAKHFLSSESRFQECREAARRKKLLMARVDLRDRDYLRQLGDVIREQNGEVTFANFTNVWEHAGSGLADSLQELQFSPQATILHSSRAYTDRLYPRMMGVCIGLDCYIQEAGSAYQLWRYKNSLGKRI